MTGPAERARGAAGAALTTLPRKADGARPAGASEKAEADATNAARRATAFDEYMIATSTRSVTNFLTWPLFVFFLFRNLSLVQILLY